MEEVDQWVLEGCGSFLNVYILEQRHKTCGNDYSETVPKCRLTLQINTTKPRHQSSLQSHVPVQGKTRVPRRVVTCGWVQTDREKDQERQISCVTARVPPRPEDGLCQPGLATEPAEPSAREDCGILSSHREKLPLKVPRHRAFPFSHGLCPDLSHCPSRLRLNIMVHTDAWVLRLRARRPSPLAAGFPPLPRAGHTRSALGGHPPVGPGICPSSGTTVQYPEMGDPRGTPTSAPGH